jgi:hypothetical protein
MVVNKKKIISRIAIFFVCVLPFSGWAATTGKINGKVVDANTREPLPGVNVMILGTSMGAATDPEGDYYIINIPPGQYDVQAKMMGYKMVTKTGVAVQIDHTSRVDFGLEETVLTVGEAVTVISERPLVEKDNTATRHFVEAKEIAARPTSELSDLLTSLPGIDQAGGELLVRRGSIDQVSFLIDGMRARNPLDFQPYQNINLTAIQELEIITGGFSAEYGEAQSGVFNIVTKEGGDQVAGYMEYRYTPPGQHHWGTSFYDYSSPKFWENANARHLQWWIDHPNQWVDSNGIAGNDPACVWTPEQAFRDYINTHQPMTDYTHRNSNQIEVSLGGPLVSKKIHYFFSGKYRTAPPVMGTSYRNMGSWFDGTLKFTYNISQNSKLMASSFLGIANTDHGMQSMDLGLLDIFENRYVYFDLYGYPDNRSDGQTLKYTHVFNKDTFLELQMSRIYRYRSQWTFPNDPNGWETGVPVTDRLRAVDSLGVPISGAYNNIIGEHYTGYIYRGKDRNTDLTLSGDLTSQVNKSWQMKTGYDFTYYILNRFQEAKAYNIQEKQVYHPYEGNLYIHNKLEFEGLIMNLGLRYDFYNANDKVYLNRYDPFDIIAAALENRKPNPKTKATPMYGQLSPRIGISHPISDKTVLHFNYGHFFQRANFGDYGEGTGGDSPGLQVTGILNTYKYINEFGPATPYNLGNRELKPRKTVQYELGLERNFSGLIVDINAFYKDMTKSIRDVKVITMDNGQYITTGNSDYSDAKGVEIQVRRPLSGYWGGYLNYTWSTGIAGTSGDPDVIAPPGSHTQVTIPQDIGDIVLYDPARVKFGIIIASPGKFTPLWGLLSNMQFSVDYQIYYPHSRIISDVFRGEILLIRPSDKNADIRLRKEVNIGRFKPAFFIEMRNAFNDKWVNLGLPLDNEARIRFINSNLSVFPENKPNGAPFPDVLQYRNLPRMIVFGVAVGF